MRKHAILLAVAFAIAVCLTGCAAPGQPSSAASGTESASAGPASAEPTGGAPELEPSDASPSEAPSQSQAVEAGSSNAADAGAVFASWNADAQSLATLVAYVEAATREGGEGYVPPQDRIAVFDMDGTFLCEKAPVYADYMLLLHRVLDDSNYDAPQEMRELCDSIRALADTGATLNDPDLGKRKNDALAESFAGMGFDEFHAYVADFMAKQQVEGFEGMTYGESFYQPMLQVIDYLKANDFDVYVVSACEREVARAVVEVLGIDPSHVIGSDWTYTATNQGAEEGLDYTYTKDDELVIGSHYLGETGKTNKVIAIQREIGKQPVLAFGNSSGDFAMLNYALDNDEYPSAAFLVVADDTQREYGNDEKAADMRASADAAGWTVISMRDDWATIYGDGVEKTHLRADENAEEADVAAAA